MDLTIDRDYIVNTLTHLIRINSVNPSLVPGAPGEGEIAAYVADELRKLELDVAVHEPAPGRPSVVGQLAGSSKGRSLMLNAHFDTVGVDGMPNPFSAEIREGKMFGRGAYDMKGSLAACMAAAKALVDAGATLGGDLLVAAVADEEYASMGTLDLIERYSIDAAIVTEATELQICLAHKGFIWLEVETTGRAAHGSRADLGIDAILRMGRFLAELDRLEKKLQSRDGHPLVGPPSLHAAMIEGGTGLSTYASRCTLKIERRTIPGETRDLVVEEIEEILARCAAADSTFRGRAEAFFVREPFEVSADTAIVRTLGQAATKVLGRTPAHVGQTMWMDSALLAAVGIDTVVMGPSGAGAHSREEWVDLDSVATLAHILAQTALQYCR